MSFKTVMNSIGNAFKTGWNNGNIQKGVTITGLTAFSVGMTGSMIHDLKHCRSIFGGGCGCNSFGFGGGMNTYGYNPMNMFGFNPMNTFSVGNSYSNMNLFSGMNMLNTLGTNSYNTQLGNMMAYQWGIDLVKQQQAEMSTLYQGLNFNSKTKELEKLSYSNTDAGEVSADVTITKGKAFDEGTTALGTVSDAKTVIIANNVTNGRTSDKVNYKTELCEIAKSYAKYIGGDDGKINLDEYVKYEINILSAQLPNATKEQLEMMIKRAFIQMDLNGDDSIDWREMASTIATYDAAGKGTGKLDGKISQTDYTQAHKTLVNGTFGEENWKNYITLFPDLISDD